MGRAILPEYWRSTDGPAPPALGPRLDELEILKTPLTPVLMPETFDIVGLKPSSTNTALSRSRTSFRRPTPISWPSE